MTICAWPRHLRWCRRFLGASHASIITISTLIAHFTLFTHPAPDWFYPRSFILISFALIIFIIFFLVVELIFVFFFICPVMIVQLLNGFSLTVDRFNGLTTAVSIYNLLDLSFHSFGFDSCVSGHGPSNLQWSGYVLKIISIGNFLIVFANNRDNVLYNFLKIQC